MLKGITYAYILLIVCFCSGCGATTTGGAVKDKQLKVAAYNVEFGKHATAKEMGTYLKGYDFDIICFSEAPGGEWIKDVADELGLEHYILGQYSTVGHDDKYKAIVSRTPLYNQEEVLMVDTMHTAVKALTQVTGKELAVYAVHFPVARGDAAYIAESTAKIAAFVNYLSEHQSAEKYPIVLGDFNFTVSQSGKPNPLYEMFVELGFEVTWSSLGTKVNQLSSLVDADSIDENGRVIDHIMYLKDNMRVVDGNIIEMERPLSDHKPVWAQLSF